MSTRAARGPHCGVLGCQDKATVIIQHPTGGRMVACEGCADGHTVVGFPGGAR